VAAIRAKLPIAYACLREKRLSAACLPSKLRLALLLFTTAGSPAVLACPAGQTEVCVVSCFCAPGDKDEVGALFANVNRLAAVGLESWLLQSHRAALMTEVQRIPLHIRAQLEAYYDVQVLDSVRYKIGDETQLNTANAMLQNPDVNAVTMLDIIVFRHAEDAQNNLALWAHELKHVQQYQEWGAGGFAERYTRDYRIVEAPAYSIQSQVERALRASAKLAKPNPAH
jgi:hypothetical protein